MKPLATLPLILAPAAAGAHPGHLADVAGHDHIAAGVAIGLAIGVAIWGALKGRPKDEAEDRDEATPEDELQDA
ncbi:DUF6732 family protein [Maritimibacter fusiformis]|uniref:Uncharacterized protein n=1 Tax=Maritimibacter fusiformis TaxID=2603819 RepID=A0A5D0RGF3_9RHOB|nr:DUF6732 family protein [Maritimibacter fusiformis]TYB80016.1 hypothetical protein FVF75_14365 [Maritimibacter fusiformis]